METIHSVSRAHDYVSALRHGQKTVGLVPTMGALHEGHLSLVRESTRVCDATIATIFVNPTQFAPSEDLAQYPRTLEDDCRQLGELGVDAVFVPDGQAMYPDGFSTYVSPPEAARSLEGSYRPEHFRGVTTIVLKLFNILPATHAFFGQKDFQQLKVIETMVRDLNVPIEIIGCPIVRENDGLAMSSRNRYLNPEQRQRALVLSQALSKAQELVDGGHRNAQELSVAMREVLTGIGGKSQGVDKIDYATVVSSDTLAPIGQADKNAVALIAAHVGSTRLIDNQILA